MNDRVTELTFQGYNTRTKGVSSRIQSDTTHVAVRKVDGACIDSFRGKGASTQDKKPGHYAEGE